MSEPTLVIPGITDPPTLACIARSRTYKQYVQMVQDTLSGRCPFCELQENILVNGVYWVAFQSRYPEKNTRHHFLIVPKRHIIDSRHLTPNEQGEWWDVLWILGDKYKLGSRGVLMRDGDATLGAGTIQHLHSHMMVPDGTGRVESPFYKGVEDEMTGVERAIVFEKLRSRSESWMNLSSRELELINNRIAMSELT